MPRPVLLAALLVFAFPAAAAEKVFQNDSFVSSAGTPVNAAQMTTGEAVAVRFKLDTSDRPALIKRIQVLAVDDPNWPGTECGSFYVRVYEDSGVHAPDPDGAPIFDSELAGDTSFDIQGTSDGLQEIPLDSFPPIYVDAEGVRIEIRAALNQCAFALGNNHYPIVFVDSDGFSGPGLNFFWSGFGTPGLEWRDAQTLGLGGDFVMRVVADVPGACQPQCQGKVCGPDGCGFTCGSCPGGQVCTSGLCCTPSCEGKACGSDGCGGSCGTCPANHTCTAQGACECLPDCEGLACGSDGCGGSCGACPDPCTGAEDAPDLCHEGACATPCCPACEGNECGNDGCGGICGTCESGFVCQEGVCEPTGEDVIEPDSDEPDASEPDVGPDAEPDAEWTTPDIPSATKSLRIDSVVPAEGMNTRTTDILILGWGFQVGLTARLDADHLIVKAVDDTSIEAEVPIGLSAGTKTLVVKNPDGQVATLAGAFEVNAETTSSSDSGGSSCTASPKGSPAPLALMLALALALALRRRAAPR